MTGAVKSVPVRPFSRVEWLIAGRYLRARRQEKFASVIALLTLIGVALGVATLIVVMSVMNGFRAEILGKMLGLDGHIEVTADKPLADYLDLAARIEGLDGVRLAFPYVEGEALASGSYQSTGVKVRGLSSEAIDKLAPLKNGVAGGGWDQWDSAGGVAIGSKLAERLGVGLGDPVTLVNPEGTLTPFGMTPAVRSYPVNVIFNLGMPEFDGYYLFMPMEPAQSYFKLFEDRLRPGATRPGVMATDAEIDAAYERVGLATGVEIFAKSPDAMTGLKSDLAAALGEGYTLTDWRERNATFFSALQVERVVMFVILSLIILVAAFNIISSLVMLVKDKGPDIAILRTMGATPGAILRIFAMSGFAIGMFGTLAGLVLGLLIAENAESLRAALEQAFNIPIFPPALFAMDKLPSLVDPGEVTMVVILSLALTFVATLYPAWRAARLDPVRGLGR